MRIAADDPERLTLEQARRVIEALPLAPIQYQPSGPLIDLGFVLAAQVGTSLYVSTRMVTADLRLYNSLRSGPYAGLVLWVEDGP